MLKALVIFETTFSSLYINSPHVVRQDLGQPENTADELSGHPVSEWEPPCKIPVRKERQRIHEESSSLSSLRLSSLSSPLSTSSFATVSTLPPLDIAKVDPVDRGEDLSNHAKVSVPTWSDEELQRDPVIKPTPTIPVHSDWEKPAVSRLTKWSTSVQNRYGV
ncbi:hypothetical protein B0H21DRAFT_823222 [Amylocystis lapponica]|nr:hypothetical protein B0H21DRAFT_823222 [Amylocystis lapponica]